MTYDLQGPIEVGQRFIWEKDNPKARINIVVTKVVEYSNDETAIHTKQVHGGDEVWNDESRFREACVRSERI